MKSAISTACLAVAAVATLAAAAPAQAQSVRVSTRWFKSDIDQDGCNASAFRVLHHSSLQISKTGGTSTVGVDDNHTVMVICDAPGLVILTVAWRQRPGVEAETAEVNDLMTRLRRRMD